MSEPVAEGSPVAEQPPATTNITASRGFAQWLSLYQVSLAFTSYQTGQLFLVGVMPNGGLSLHQRIFERAMGIVGNAQRIYLGGLYQLWRFENVLRPNEVTTASSTSATCRATRRRSATWTSMSSASAAMARWCSSTPSIPAWRS